MKQPVWMFDESKPIGVDYSDRSLVSDYDRQHERFRNFKDEAYKIAKVLNISKPSVVLDIGCGTGGLTTHLAGICKHVYAVDASEAMVDILQKKVREQNLNNIDVIQSGFLSYEHTENKVDAIIVNMSLHHLPDFWKQIALSRLYEILKDDGKLFLSDVVYDFKISEYQRAIDNWISTMRSQAGKQIADETLIHVREEFSTWQWIMTGMLERAGFIIDDNSEIMPNIQVYICSKTE